MPVLSWTSENTKGRVIRAAINGGRRRLSNEDRSRLLADGAFSNQLSQQRARLLCLPCAQIKREGLEERGAVRRNQPLGLNGNSAVQLRRDLWMRSPVILRLHKIERLERSGSQ